MLRALFLICGLLWAATAHADGHRKTALNWVRASGAEQCIDPRSLAQRVEGLTGPVLVPLSESEIAIEAQVEPGARGGFRMRFTVTDRRGAVQGERVHEQQATDCRQLDEAVVFMLALAIDPELALPDDVAATFAQETAPEEALLEELEASPPQPVVLAPPGPEAPAAASPKAPSSVRSPPLRTELALLPTVAWGAAPELAPGLAFAVHRQVSDVVLLYGALRGLPPLRRAEVAEGRSLAVQSYALSLGPCAGRALRALALRACAGAEAGVFHGAGRGFGQNSSAFAFQAAAVVSAQLLVRLSARVRLHVQGGGALHFARPRFAYGTPQDPDNTAFRAPRLGADLGLGVSVAI